MGINFGRMAQGIATGYIGGAIKDKESKDNARLEVVKAAGMDYYTNQLPAHKKAETNRASAYNQLSTMFGSEEAADYFDANGFITGDGKDVERIQKMLEDKNIKPGAFKEYIPTSNYSERYKQRQTDFETRFEPVAKTLTMQQGGLGKSTVDGLLTKPAGDITTTEQITTPAVEGTQTGPIVTEGTPESTETVTSTVPRTTSDTAMSAFFIPKGNSVNIGKEADIAASVQGFRNFSKGININATTGAVSMTFGNVKNIEYSSIKSVMNDLAKSEPDKYVADGKTSLSLLAEDANTQLKKQTQIFTSKLFEPNTFKDTESTEGLTGSTAGNLRPEFLEEYPTVKDQRIFLLQHMAKLGTTSEKRYFALSFPSNAVYPGTEINIRETLIKAAQ
tara:strand:+ start:830 stop:2002 length:1173 start_codon:yes stop_codon:yes gene_type:complete